MKVKNILISQTPPADFDKTPYADLKRKYSVNFDFYKFFKIESVSTREFRDTKVNILNYTAVVFSSKNTIDHFFSLVKELRVEIPEAMKYFCTTESTALYLQKYIAFRKRKIFFAKNSSTEAIFELFAKNKELKYLIPCSTDSVGTPYDEFFTQNEIEYSQAIVFKTVPADLKKDIDISKYDMIVFFSPSGIRSLRYNFPDFEQGDIAFGALGHAVEEAIKAEGWTVHAVAPTKEAPSITAALDIFFKDHATKRR
ncbi:MAG: uroporphyrinogen-III synthase [Bacteroidales bacterium]|nr:uroporphyrinogen-III synthase [Bacteroidales bacterium]